MIESGKIDSIAELSKHIDIDKNCVSSDLRLLRLAPYCEFATTVGSIDCISSYPYLQS